MSCRPVTGLDDVEGKIKKLNKIMSVEINNKNLLTQTIMTRSSSSSSSTSSLDLSFHIELNTLKNNVVAIRSELEKQKKEVEDLKAYNQVADRLNAMNYARVHDMAIILGLVAPPQENMLPETIDTALLANDFDEGRPTKKRKTSHKKQAQIMPQPPVAYNASNYPEMIRRGPIINDAVIYQFPETIVPHNSPSDSPQQMPVTFPTPPPPLFANCFDADADAANLTNHYYDFDGFYDF